MTDVTSSSNHSLYGPKEMLRAMHTCKAVVNLRNIVWGLGECSSVVGMCLIQVSIKAWVQIPAPIILSTTPNVLCSKNPFPSGDRNKALEIRGCHMRSSVSLLGLSCLGVSTDAIASGETDSPKRHTPQEAARDYLWVVHCDGGSRFMPALLLTR